MSQSGVYRASSGITDAAGAPHGGNWNWHTGQYQGNSRSRSTGDRMAINLLHYNHVSVNIRQCPKLPINGGFFIALSPSAGPTGSKDSLLSERTMADGGLKAWILLVASLILLSACGGGQSSGDSAAGASIQPITENHSAASVLIVDDGFTASAAILYQMHKDPLLAGVYTGDHGDQSAFEIGRITDANLIGYVPLDDSQPPVYPESCFNNMSNCSTTAADLDAPVYWAADNGIQIVLVRWGGCCFDARHFAAAQYAYERGTTVIWPAGNDAMVLDYTNSPYMLVVSSGYKYANTGNAVDAYIGVSGTSHSGTRAAGEIAGLYESLKPTPDAAGAAKILAAFMALH